MDRRAVRTNVFKIMFQIEFHSEEQMEELISLYEEEHHITKAGDLRTVHDKVMNIVDKKTDIDAAIEEYSNGWKRNRIGKAELAILRVAIYEILFDETVPDSVAANEAVELAKEYGEEKAPSFINGILGKVIEGKKQA